MPLYRIENGHRIKLTAAEETAVIEDQSVNNADRLAARKVALREAIEARIIRRVVKRYLATATDTTLRDKYQQTVSAINTATDSAALDTINPNLAT